MRKAVFTLNLIALLGALHAAPAAAFDAWTDGQVTKAGALAALHMANWGQHRAMAYNDAAPAIDGVKAVRPGQATHPSVAAADPDYGRVDRRFALSAVAGAVVLAALPSAWRDDALSVGLVIEAGMVGRQLQLGVGWRF